jgi:aminopeptidase N
VPCPYPKYDIGFVPRLDATAISIPGLMLVNENLLARMADPQDDFVAMVCAHEVAHLWFGGHVGMRWWDDLWQDEAMASYLSYTVIGDAWPAFCYREKERAYAADALPGRQPVSSPVASAADALFRQVALTYSKGAAVIRQLAALIGDDALRAGLADFMRRFGGGSTALDDLIGCWSRSSGRDLAGWAQEWLRTEGASMLRASVQAGPDGTIGSLAVEQDQPRTHRLGIGLYGVSGSGPSGAVLRRRRVISAEISGARCEVPVPAGEPLPDLVVLNDGDLTYAEISFDPASLDVLAAAAMDVGDPVTEAVCWNAAWRMVTTGALAGADFAGLVARRGARGSGRWRRGSRPARRLVSSWRLRARGCPAQPRTAWYSTATCAGGCCGRWRPAAWPPRRTWTRWPPRTRSAGSRTWSAAARCGRTPRPRRRPGSWRWPKARTGGRRKRPRAGSGCPARRRC